MRAIVSLVLATALVTTPLKMVFAQAEQQEAVSVQQNALSDSSGHRLIRVPPVTDNTARLWQLLASEDALADIFAEDSSNPGLAPRAIPRGARIVLTALAVIAAAAVVLGVLFLLSYEEA